MHARALLFAGVALLALTNVSHAAAAYSLDRAKSSLKFTFSQAGAKNEGQFKNFATNLTLPEGGAAGALDVTVRVASLDTADKERDDTLRGAEFFAVTRFPTARFVATKLSSVGAGRYEAVGRLTIRDITREVRIPFEFRRTSDGAGRMVGEFTIKRLEFGVGQGDWLATDWVADAVKLSFSLRLVQGSATTGAAS
jgi:polyisoprenoid-binding protein YceI